MNELRLKPGITFAPSGHPYTDPRTGFKVDAYERGFDGAVNILIEHRRANSPRVYPATEYIHFSPSAVRQEILRHLKTEVPHIFRGEPVPAVNRTETGFPKACVKCGGVSFSPQWCATCGSGQRQIGYICDGCKKTYPM